MFLAVILYCSTFTDVKSCEVMVSKTHLFETEQLCEADIKRVTKVLLDTEHFVKAKCFATPEADDDPTT